VFKEQEPVGSKKIIVDNKIIDQVNSFNCLGNLIPYEEKVNISAKLSNYLKIMCIINDMFKAQRTLKKTRIKLYDALAFPALLYGSENWTIKGRDARRITTAEMKYIYIYVYKRQDILGQIIKQTHRLRRNST
jgi:hypothetical protein